VYGIEDHHDATAETRVRFDDPAIGIRFPFLGSLPMTGISAADQANGRMCGSWRIRTHARLCSSMAHAGFLVLVL